MNVEQKLENEIVKASRTTGIDPGPFALAAQNETRVVTAGAKRFWIIPTWKDLIKAAANRGHLVKKAITDKRGHKTFRWFAPEEHKLEKRKAAHPHLQEKPVNEINGKLIPRPGPWIKALPGLPAQTWETAFTGPPDQGGKPTPERQPLHDEIVKSMFGNAKPVPEGQQPVAIFMMGGPASGKTSITKGIADDSFVRADADLVKEKLPEYKRAVANRAKNAAAMAHEESSYVVKRARNEGFEGRYNMVVDGTGSSIKTYLDNLKKAKEKGYKVVLMYAHVDSQEAEKRARVRARKTGRWVPIDTVLKPAYQNIPGNFLQFAKLVDQINAFDMSGRPPKKVWSEPPPEKDEAFVSQLEKHAEMQKQLSQPAVNAADAAKESPGPMPANQAQPQAPVMAKAAHILDLLKAVAAKEEAETKPPAGKPNGEKPEAAAPAGKEEKPETGKNDPSQKALDDILAQWTEAAAELEKAPDLFEEGQGVDEVLSEPPEEDAQPQGAAPEQQPEQQQPPAQAPPVQPAPAMSQAQSNPMPPK